MLCNWYYGYLLLLMEASMWQCNTDGTLDDGLQHVAVTQSAPTQYHSQVNWNAVHLQEHELLPHTILIQISIMPSVLVLLRGITF